MKKAYRLILNPFLNVYRKFIQFIIVRTLASAISIIVTYLSENRKYQAMKNVKKGFEDHRFKGAAEDISSNIILKRITSAYLKAKEDQKNLKPPYRVGALWQSTLDKQYQGIITALRSKDIKGLRAILENFSRADFSASQGGGVDVTNIKKQLLYKYLFVNTWYKYFNLYKEAIQREPDLDYPLVGNPAGLFYNGKVIPIEAIRFSYCAEQILPLLEDNSHPVICEIGGGNGGQAYTLMSKSSRASTYIDLDIPEMLVIATYFLLMALPDKSFLLYGEGSWEDDALKKYDIAMLPYFLIPQIEANTVDLFFNQRSFSEMDGKTVLEYVHQIERICRGYFMHINHNKKFTWEVEGVHTENLPSSSVIPDAKRFKKIYDYPWIFNRLEEELMYKGVGDIAFLYEKRKP